MKKAFAVIIALILAVSLCVPAAAAGRGTTSGQLTPFFVDYDPQALSDLLGGLDISGFFNDMGLGDLSGLLGGFDIGSLLGDFDIGSLLGDFDILGMLGGLFGGGGDSGSDDGDTTTTTTTTSSSETTTGTPTDVPKTGDNSGINLAVAFGVLTVAAVAVVCARKKNDEE